MRTYGFENGKPVALANQVADNYRLSSTAGAQAKRIADKERRFPSNSGARLSRLLCRLNQFGK